jgi:hypothetical protein
MIFDEFIFLFVSKFWKMAEVRFFEDEALNFENIL